MKGIFSDEAPICIGQRDNAGILFDVGPIQRNIKDCLKKKRKGKVNKKAQVNVDVVR